MKGEVERRNQRIRRLAREGLTPKAIAAVEECSLTTVYRHLNPAVNETSRRASRKWKARHGGICEACGGPTSIRRDGKGAHRFCGACNPRSGTP